MNRSESAWKNSRASIMNVIGIVVILGMGLPLVAALVLPVVLGSLQASRRPAAEAKVAAELRAYAQAQAKYRLRDWDKDGVLEYAKLYTLLRTQTSGGGLPA